MPSYPQQRIFNLASKLGCTVREAARLCGRKGARVRRQRQCACLPQESEEDRLRRLRWDLKDAF